MVVRTAGGYGLGRSGCTRHGQSGNVDHCDQHNSAAPGSRTMGRSRHQPENVEPTPPSSPFRPGRTSTQPLLRGCEPSRRQRSGGLDFFVPPSPCLSRCSHRPDSPACRDGHSGPGGFCTAISPRLPESPTSDCREESHDRTGSRRQPAIFLGARHGTALHPFTAADNDERSDPAHSLCLMTIVGSGNFGEQVLVGRVIVWTPPTMGPRHGAH